MDNTTLMGAILASELQLGRTGPLNEDAYYSKYAGTKIWDRAKLVVAGVRRFLRGLTAARKAFAAAYNMKSQPLARAI